MGGHCRDYFAVTPELARRMLANLSMRLHMLVKDVEAMTLHSAAQRVIGYLARLEDESGEHGAVTFSEDGVFAVPGLPMETIVDPTGAGDAFAGGFLGCLASTEDFSSDGLRRATIYGSAMGSFCCESFSVDRLVDLSPEEIDQRFHEFRDLTRFDHAPVFADG